MYRRPFNQYSLSSVELNRFETYGAIFQYKFDTYPNGFRASRDKVTHIMSLNFQDGIIPDDVNAYLIYQVQKTLTLKHQYDVTNTFIPDESREAVLLSYSHERDRESLYLYERFWTICFGDRIRPSEPNQRSKR